jgi:6-pyruvoyltetrahydropterin/6-carboxytetrahydropterin synthase
MDRPILTITHRVSFSAAHRMHNSTLSPERNLEIFGPCNRIHGHNYAVEASLKGPLDPETGMVANLVDLMRVMQEEIFEQLDHQLLDEISWLKDTVISAETLAIAIWKKLAKRQDELGAALDLVRVFETEADSAEYRGPASDDC